VVEYREIATALGQTKNAIEKRAKREGWPAQSRAVRGGHKDFFALSDLPADVQRALARHRAKSAAPVAAPMVAPAQQDMSDYQRRIDAARRAVLAAIDKMALETGLNKAVDAVCELAAKGELHPDLQAMIPTANARPGENGRTLTRPTIMRWRAQLRDHGHCAPRHQPAGSVAPEWAGALRRVYNLPSNPTIRAAVAAMELPAGVTRPSEHQVRRWLATLPAIERERGRRSPQAMRALKGYVKRSFDHLEPMDVCVCDGYTAKWDVQHPVHGQRFRPEITRVLDVATRRTVGWSIGLAESTWTVLDAWAHAIRHNGLIAIPYTDNGAGEVGEIMTHEITGFFGRLNVVHETGRPGNPQGRGVIERAWARTFKDAAKRMVTFAGPDMDGDARKLVVKRIDRDLKIHGHSQHLPSWEEHKAWVAECIERDNNTPHRALPTLMDPITGKRRHMTPNECWKDFQARGWQPALPSPQQLTELFRPHRLGNVSREVIRFNKVDYHSPALADYHGQQVQVGFDIHDGSRIWVRDIKGRPICEAFADGHARPYFDKIKLDRAKGRRNRLLDKLAVVDAELGFQDVEAASGAPMQPDELAAVEAEFARLEAPALALVAPSAPAAGERPRFDDDESWGRWVVAHPQQATAMDKRRLSNMIRSNPSFRLLLDDITDEALEAACA
jgi:putative transposase